VYSNGNIFLFGGYDVTNRDEIYMYNIKKKMWLQCYFKMPFPIHSSAAVISKYDSSIHIIGGANDKGESQTTHYVTQMKEIGRMDRKRNKDDFRMLDTNCWIKAAWMD